MRSVTRDEGGAVAVIVAIVLVVLVGFVALAIDVSALVQERRELQNGADAGALALAKECSTTGGFCDGSTASGSTADTLADANADDGDSNVEDVCGTAAGLLACTDPPTVPNAQGYVRVRTSTAEAATGQDHISFIFAPLLDAANDGKTVHAEAIAAWGTPASIEGTTPLTFSWCEWTRFADDGLPSAPQVVYFHDGNNAEPCNNQAGQDMAGGFGWLVSDECQAAIDLEDPWVTEDPGSSASTGCDSATIQALVGTTILLPIFDETLGLGSNGEYHIIGIAAFVLTGFRLGGSPAWNNNPPCSGDERCLSGYFTEYQPVSGVSEFADPSVPDMGVTAVLMVG